MRLVVGGSHVKDIPVLAVTAFALKGDEERIIEAGCDAYMAKPISVLNFLETVEKLINRQNA